MTAAIVTGIWLACMAWLYWRMTRRNYWELTRYHPGASTDAWRQRWEMHRLEQSKREPGAQSKLKGVMYDHRT